MRCIKTKQNCFFSNYINNWRYKWGGKNHLTGRADSKTLWFQIQINCKWTECGSSPMDVFNVIIIALWRMNRNEGLSRMIIFMCKCIQHIATSISMKHHFNRNKMTKHIKYDSQFTSTIWMRNGSEKVSISFASSRMIP